MSGIFVPAGASEKLCDKSNSPLNLFFRLKEKFNCMKHHGSPKLETISLLKAIQCNNINSHRKEMLTIMGKKNLQFYAENVC